MHSHSAGAAFPPARAIVAAAVFNLQVVRVRATLIRSLYSQQESVLQRVAVCYVAWVRVRATLMRSLYRGQESVLQRVAVCYNALHWFV